MAPFHIWHLIQQSQNCSWPTCSTGSGPPSYKLVYSVQPPLTTILRSIHMYSPEILVYLRPTLTNLPISPLWQGWGPSGDLGLRQHHPLMAAVASRCINAPKDFDSQRPGRLGICGKHHPIYNKYENKIHTQIYIYIYAFANLYISICLSVYLSINLSINQSINLHTSRSPVTNFFSAMRPKLAGMLQTSCGATACWQWSLAAVGGPHCLS